MRANDIPVNEKTDPNIPDMPRKIIFQSCDPRVPSLYAILQ